MTPEWIAVGVSGFSLVFSVFALVAASRKPAAISPEPEQVLASDEATEAPVQPKRTMMFL